MRNILFLILLWGTIFADPWVFDILDALKATLTIVGAYLVYLILCVSAGAVGGDWFVGTLKRRAEKKTDQRARNT